MTIHEIYSRTTRRFLGPVVHLLDDPEVTEVLINGPSTVYAERGGRLTLEAEAHFESEAALMAAARNIAEFAGRPLHAQTHSVDARLPDGSRVHLILPPAAAPAFVFQSVNSTPPSSVSSNSWSWRR